MSSVYAKRFEAVFLCSHPRGPKLKVASAAKVIKKSQSFVKKWVKRFSDSGNVDDLPKRGTARATTKKEDTAIVKMFETNPTLRLRVGKAKLAKKGIRVSINTIRQRLCEKGIQFRSTSLKPLLTETHMEKRRNWAAENISRDWSNVVFSDEASFWAWTPVRHAWSRRETRLVQRTVKHPVKIHVWGCFSEHGFGVLELFTDNLNAQKMLKIYQRGLMKSVKKMFASEGEDWILQEDNDPKHRSRLCTDWKRENGIKTLDWPSQSPDANPIENVWGLLKSKLEGKKVRSLKQLAAAIRKIWRSLPLEYAEKLVESMPKRCQAILDNNGDFTVY